jgi:hypothetical protein
MKYIISEEELLKLLYGMEQSTLFEARVKNFLKDKEPVEILASCEQLDGLQNIIDSDVIDTLRNEYSGKKLEIYIKEVK